LELIAALVTRRNLLGVVIWALSVSLYD
jgi:hypothetical protein